MSLQVTVGYAKYNCSCVASDDDDDDDNILVIAVTIAVAVFIFLIVIIVAGILHYREEKEKRSEQGVSRYSIGSVMILDNQNNRRIPVSGDDYRELEMSEKGGQHSGDPPDNPESTSQDTTQDKQQLADDA